MGHAAAPLHYVPHRYVRWKHRFDDPEKEYCTLYCATERLTALREVLGDLRPNTKAVAEFQSVFGLTSPEVLSAGEVSWEWRQTNVLASGRIQAHGSLIDLDDVAVRQQLEEKHAALLAAYGLEHLDISAVRSPQRPVTQQLGRSLYEEGAAGILYRSNRDDRLCVALFEGAAVLAPDGEAEPLTRSVPELLQVCDEYKLSLRSALGN